MRNITKSLTIALLIALCLVFTTIPVLAFSGTPDELGITIAELDERLYELFPENFVVEGVERDRDPASAESLTVRRFLEEYIWRSRGFAVVYDMSKGEETFWNAMAGSPYFLTEQEWLSLTNDLDDTISAAQADSFLNKVKSLLNMLPSKPLDAEKAVTFTEQFVPELAPIFDMEETEEAVDFWLHLNDGDETTDVPRLCDIVHELQHERAARMRGTYRGRGSNDSIYYVAENGLSKNDQWYFDPLTGEYVTLPMQGPYVPMAAAEDIIPEALRSKWDCYLDGGIGDKGIYNILKEWSSYAVGLRMELAQAAVNYQLSHVFDDACTPYFCKGFAVAYFRGIKADYHEYYEALMADTELMTLMVHLDTYCEQLFNQFSPLFAQKDSTEKRWTETEEMQEQWAEILQASKCFRDVAQDSPYTSAIYAAASHGWMVGTDNHTFAPDSLLTRAQAVVVLYRLAGTGMRGETEQYMDVPADSYYAEAALWSKSMGLTWSADEQFLYADTPVSEGEFLAMLSSITGADTTEFGGGEENLLTRAETAALLTCKQQDARGAE